MRHSLVAPLSGAAQCDIVIAIYRISLSFAGSKLGNDPTARKQLRWQLRLDLICTSGQRRTNSLVARTYARWPLRASGVLDPLARTGPPSKKSRRASGPAVNVEAWCVMCLKYRIIILINNHHHHQPLCPVVGRRPQHVVSKLPCLVLSSAILSRSSICPGRLSTAWLVSLVVFSCNMLSKR